MTVQEFFKIPLKGGDHKRTCCGNNGSCNAAGLYRWEIMGYADRTSYVCGKHRAEFERAWDSALDQVDELVAA